MKFTVLTLFPEMIEQGFHTSITGRAAESGLLSLRCVNIRDYALDRYGHVDDYPYGGGAGMVMQAPPIYRAYQDAVGERTIRPRLIYLTPQGKVFTQAMAVELAKEEELFILCGHYEGVDERVLDEIATDRISIGDYVLTGGELPALVLMDAVSRMVPGVLSNEESGETESFMNGLLEYPQYTRPEVFLDRPVPEILRSGHHAKIDRWRRNESLRRTYEVRPELLENIELDKEDRLFLHSLKAEAKKE
ncbi:MAG: tRNA (guanosine(37)-N1)-methyltransferase TrmD [Lachnospiraceae bacterium]|nr:tRNA (guanosine(37)-N1)-methyltransferase TrmD [Lachnospiraceae bacterium]